MYYYLFATDTLGASRADPVTAPTLTHAYVVGYVPPTLYINEYMADNDAVIEDPDEPLAFEDWIEIYNAGDLSRRYGDYPFRSRSDVETMRVDKS